MNDDTAVVLARMEGKIDLLYAELRATNARGEDHEVRLRTLEARPVGITPRVLLSTMVGFATILSATVAAVAFLIRA